MLLECQRIEDGETDDIRSRGGFMADYDELKDHAEEIRGQFKNSPKEYNQEMANQLKLLSDDDLRIHYEAYPSNVYVKAEVARRGLK